MSQMSFDFTEPVKVPEPLAKDEAKQSVEFLVQEATNHGSGPAYFALLRKVAKFKQYKPFNALLAQLQRPGATYVLPPQQWRNQYHRVIKPGEQPIVVMVPFGPVMFVYDVSQTVALDGAPALPALIENPYAMPPIHGAETAVYWLIENAKLDGVRVTFVPSGSQSAGCVSHAHVGLRQDAMFKRGSNATRSVVIRYEVEVNQAQSPTERLATLSHELGHLYSGHIGTHDPDLWASNVRLIEGSAEVEAESVAYLVCQRLDPTIQMPAHLHQYRDEQRQLPPYDLNRILTSAGRVLEMTEGWAPRRPKAAKGKGSADEDTAGTLVPAPAENLSGTS